MFDLREIKVIQQQEKNKCNIYRDNLVLLDDASVNTSPKMHPILIILEWQKRDKKVNLLKIKQGLFKFKK